LTNRLNAGVGCFPVIVRPVNSHAGHGLSKLEDCEQVAEYLAANDSEEFFAAPFIDYRSQDGMYRKYRIAVVDGKPFAAHMAISQHWMVHYLNADMLQSQRNRNSEAKFMSSFDIDFAVKHRAALQAMDLRIGLDYYSIDCAETPDERLLVFELDSGAVVHSMDSVELFPYKGPQMQRVFGAFHQMLRRKSIGAQKLSA
jgi:glutathione synthase/RimK-type ligase-like ATP-grasp enzyme